MTNERDELFAAKSLVMVAGKAMALSYAPMTKLRKAEREKLRKVADAIHEAELALVGRLVETHEAELAESSPRTSAASPQPERDSRTS